MSEENSSHVTRAELQAELRAFQYRILLYFGAAVGLLKLEISTPITIGAVLVMVGKSAWVLLSHH